MSTKESLTPLAIKLPLIKVVSSLRFRESTFGKREVFDPVRKKWVILEPEEMVRQALVTYLSQLPGYSLSRMAVERAVQGSYKKNRYDVLVYDYSLEPFLLVECKSPDVSLNSEAFQQISWYNQNIEAPYYLVTNGPTTYCCAINHQEKKASFLSILPNIVPK